MKTTNKIALCDKIIEDTKEFKGYIASVGNECAYTDRLLEEIKRNLDELMNEYNNIGK